MLHRTVDVNFVQSAHDFVAKPVAEPCQVASFLSHLFRSDRTSLAQTDNSGHVEGSRTHATLVAAAVDNGRNLNTRILAPNIQRPHTLRAVHFVSRNRHYVD